jgi:hypothetical protein
MKTAARLLAFLLLFASLLHAQKHEIALSGGGDFSSAFSTSPAVQATYAGRLFSAPFVSLYGELPLGIGFDQRPSLSTSHFSSVFFTPGLKLKVSALGFAPYAFVGGGVAHFKVTSTTGSSSTSGAVDFGGGLDVNFLPHIGLRGEVRDYYSGITKLTTTSSGRQHNVFVTAGLVLRF